MLHSKLIKRNDIDDIFNSLADNYLRLGGKQIINIYLVGGASIVLKFDYRVSTIDVDAFFQNNQLLSKSIENVSKLLNLPNDWLNSDFVNTPSYTPIILEKAKFHKEYKKIIRTYLLEPKYLIAMKLKSSRPTGGDLDDIIKMIYESRYKNIPISYDEIIKAYNELYEDYSNTYDYFLKQAREAFETPVEDFEHLFKRY